MHISMILILVCAAVDEARIMTSSTDFKDDFSSKPFNQEVCEVNVMDARSRNYNFALLQYSKSNAWGYYTRGGVDPLPVSQPYTLMKHYRTTWSVAMAFRHSYQM